MLPYVLDTAAKVVILAALAYSSIVALTHWAVRRRHLQPFGAWPRLVRRASDPVLMPLERRIVRSGGSPQNAPLWLLGLVVVLGLLLITLVRWGVAVAARVGTLAQADPRLWVLELIGFAFTVVTLALIVRVIGSWFGLSPYRPVGRVVYALTNWLVRPIQRLLPPFGVFDLSPLIAYFVLWIGRPLVLGLTARLLGLR